RSQMPKPRAAKLETATARRRLDVRKKPYWTTISPGIALGYRRNEGAGTWSVRVADGGVEWIKRIALADDLEPTSPPHALPYWQAIDQARALARRQPGEAIDKPPAHRQRSAHALRERFDLARRQSLQLETRTPASACLDPEQAGRALGRYRASQVARQPLGQGARGWHRQQDKDGPAGGTGTRRGARPAHRKPAGLESWPRRSAGRAPRPQRHPRRCHSAPHRQGCLRSCSAARAHD